MTLPSLYIIIIQTHSDGQFFITKEFITKKNVEYGYADLN